MGEGEEVMGAVSSNVSGRNARMGGATYRTLHTAQGTLHMGLQIAHGT